ncbi:hypothetical protein BV22DRAFT_1049543 [Leucogyrophana mollusca]|uniref:Uncharacterized protein n=1 Tax=Leucogyrophana mollusca TaxID=85980 RepID=A0ACB8B829_9AGAM|nr:hypothetical protein BV22DRAFT_1049543 [Leucogyrophana mollusca]
MSGLSEFKESSHGFSIRKHYSTDGKVEYGHITAKSSGDSIPQRHLTLIWQTYKWIWVRGKDSPDAKETRMIAAINEASLQLKEVTERVEAIKNDAAIPMQSDKKTGVKSQKEVLGQVRAEAAEKLKEISVKHGYVWGKWLIFAPPNRVHSIWASIATHHCPSFPRIWPLASTSAFLTKVSMSPEIETSSYQHVKCLYLPDVYDKESVTQVSFARKIYLFLVSHLSDHEGTIEESWGQHGVESDLYTLIGLDSKHPSGISPTVWKSTALLKYVEIKWKRQVKDKKAAVKLIKRAQEIDSKEDEEPEAKKKTAMRTGGPVLGEGDRNWFEASLAECSRTGSSDSCGSLVNALCHCIVMPFCQAADLEYNVIGGPIWHWDRKNRLRRPSSATPAFPNFHFNATTSDGSTLQRKDEVLAGHMVLRLLRLVLWCPNRLLILGNGSWAMPPSADSL